MKMKTMIGGLLAVALALCAGMAQAALTYNVTISSTSWVTVASGKTFAELGFPTGGNLGGDWNPTGGNAKPYFADSSALTVQMQYNDGNNLKVVKLQFRDSAGSLQARVVWARYYAGKPLGTSLESSYTGDVLGFYIMTSLEFSPTAVTFNFQGGSGGSASVSVACNMAMPSATMPMKAGSEFLGYFDAPTGGTQYYKADGTSARTFDKTADTTLYAQWADYLTWTTLSGTAPAASSLGPELIVNGGFESGASINNGVNTFGYFRCGGALTSASVSSWSGVEGASGLTKSKSAIFGDGTVRSGTYAGFVQTRDTGNYDSILRNTTAIDLTPGAKYKFSFNYSTRDGMDHNQTLTAQFRSAASSTTTKAITSLEKPTTASSTFASKTADFSADFLTKVESWCFEFRGTASSGDSTVFVDEVSVKRYIWNIICSPGSYATGESMVAAIPSGESLKLPGAMYTRSNCVQGGWSKSANGSTKDYDLEATVTFSEGMTLYPYWEVDYNSTWTELTGSTSGKTLESGCYFIRANTTFSNETTGGSGLSIAEGAVVSIYVPAGVTLTATGAAGEGTTGGGAGILVPESSKLYLIGSGKVVATGGKAADGSDGSTGSSPSVSIGGQGVSDYWRGITGTGGKGGAGGGGGGAGIGTCGGAGGAGGAGGGSQSFGWMAGDAYQYLPLYKGDPGYVGINGSSAAVMGRVNVQPGLTVEAHGGAASEKGGTYQQWAGGYVTDVGSIRPVIGKEYLMRIVSFYGANGGGGGSGYAGADIGRGGGGGGGGSGGQGGSWFFTNGNPSYGLHFIGRGGKGYVNGDGSGDSTPAYAYFSGYANSPYGSLADKVRASGSGAGAGAAQSVGETAAPVYAVTYLNADETVFGGSEYAVGSATTITLPECAAGYKWVNTVYGKPCGSPSDLSSAPVAAFTGTIDARNVYGDLAFRATLNDVSVTLTAGEGEGYGFAVSNLTAGAEIQVGEDGQYVLPAGAKVGIYAVAKPGYVILAANPLVIEKVDENTRNVVDSDLPRPTVSKPGSGDEPQKVIEKVKGDDGKTYTAVLENKSESGEVVENPVRAMSVEGLGEVASSKKTDVTLSVTPKDVKSVGQDVAKKIDGKLKEASEGKGFDSVAFVDLSVSFNAVKQENCELESVITLHIPWPVRTGGSYGVVRMHNDEPQMIPQDEGNAVDGEFFTVDFEKREIVLRVKKFSDYAIAETPPGMKVGENAYALVEGGVCEIYGTGSATNFPATFDRKSVTSATIGEGVTEIGARFFKDFRKMKRIEGGAGLLRFGEKAFYRCLDLEEITIANPDFEVSSLENAVVYQMAINAKGEFYMVPKVTVEGYTETLYGKRALTDAEWTKIGALAEQNLEALKAEGVYHFFQTRLVKGVAQ